jgi:hypothetical protein
MILSFLAPQWHVSHFLHFISIIHLTDPVLSVEERRRSLSRFRNESHRSDRSALPVILRVPSPDGAGCPDPLIESGRLLASAKMAASFSCRLTSSAAPISCPTLFRFSAPGPPGADSSSFLRPIGLFGGIVEDPSVDSGDAMGGASFSVP